MAVELVGDECRVPNPDRARVGLRSALRESIVIVMTAPSETDSLEAVLDPTRLAAVRATGLLDSAEEEAFDRLTRLAAKLTGAPVTFISLVDQGRDFYKSCFGFPEPLASERELTGTTFCHYALVSRGPLIIEDTLAHPIYRNVPTVHSLGVRAYLGIPLSVNGAAIGSFCAIDFQPRTWSPLQVEVMEELAASTMREIELRAAIGTAETERSRLKALLTHVPAAVIFADGASRRVLLWNQKVEEILGTVPAAQRSPATNRSWPSIRMAGWSSRKNRRSSARFSVRLCRPRSSGS